MKEYIKREAITKLIAEACAECREACEEFDGFYADCNQCLLHGVKSKLTTIPAADVREVVRCRDCKSYNRPRLGFCETHLVRMHVDDFCSYGKKKEES